MPFKMRLMLPIVSVLLVSAAHGSPTGDAGARAAASTVVKRAAATVDVSPATTSPPVELVESRPVESGLGDPSNSSYSFIVLPQPAELTTTGAAPES